MARKPRFIIPGVPQHVIQRGNNREPCFFAEADYARHLDDLHVAAEKNKAAIHAYVLMTNHVHFAYNYYDNNTPKIIILIQIKYL